MGISLAKEILITMSFLVPINLQIYSSTTKNASERVRFSVIT